MKWILTCALACSLCAGAPAGEKKPAKPGEVRELLTILEKTESPEAFLMAVEALADLAPARPGLVPAVIRNADRLGLLRGSYTARPTKEQEEISEIIGKLVHARMEVRDRALRARREMVADRGPIGAGLGSLVGISAAGAPEPPLPEREPLPLPAELAPNEAPSR